MSDRAAAPVRPVISDAQRMLARERLLQLRLDELGRALRDKHEQSLDMLHRLQEREEQAVRRSEERFRLLVETVSDYAIFMTDADGRIVSWNEGAARITGYGESDVLQRSIAILYPPESPEDGTAAVHLARAAEAGRLEAEGWRLRRGGAPFWASVVLTALYDPDRRLLGFAVITRDLSERRRAELALRQTAAELQRSNQELEQFAYVASHDLQEPLRKIQAFGERLQVGYVEHLDAQGVDFVRRMCNAAARMQTLIEDLLTFSRVTTRTLPFEPVDLGQLAHEVVGDLEARVESTGGGVEIGELPVVHADRGQMRRLLQNLIANALKFHRPGVPPRVRVRAEQVTAAETRDGPHHWVRLTVEDNGIGFDEKYLDRIFEIFQRLHGREAYEGTGMGLAICRKIVERHGGTISARSTPGVGSAFIVTLPAGQADRERA